jgi:hypothetical protein
MRPLLFVAAILAAACDTGGSSNGDTDDTDVAPAATFARVEDEIIKPSCAFSICPGGGSSGGLSLTGDAAADHAALVGVASSGKPAETLVIAGDPDGSYLVKKLEDAAGIEGDPMPSTGALTDAQIQLVRDWIADGAKP